MADVNTEVRRLCDGLSSDCLVKVLPRPATKRTAPGLDVIVTFRGAGETPPESWKALRPAVEAAMERRGFEVLTWLCWSGRLPDESGPSHCIALVT